jgi:hypothetical protein
VEPPGAVQSLLLRTLWPLAALLGYRDAEKRGAERGAAWRVGAFLASGIVVPVYFVRVWLRSRARR